MSVDNTLAERGSRYGDFSDHAELAQHLQDVMRGAPNDRWEMMSAVQKQALTVIAVKIARILCGDPNYPDNWHDIQGYAKLAEDRLPKAGTITEAEDLVGGWHTWDCRATQLDARAGPPVQTGFYIDKVKYSSGETVEVNGRNFLWDASPFPEQRIVAYCLERLP